MTKELAPTTMPTELEHIEKARGQVEQRKASLEEELAQADRWLDWFDQGIEIAKANGSPPALPAAESRPGKPPPRRKPGKSAGPKEKGKRSHAAGEETRRRILEYVGAHPGCFQMEVIKGTGLSQAQVSTNVIKLAAKGELRREGRALFLPGAASAEGKAEAGQEPAAAEPDEAGPTSHAPRSTKRHDPDPVADRLDRNDDQVRKQDAIMKFVREHPNSTVKDIAKGAGLDQGECKRVIQALSRSTPSKSKRIWGDDATPRRYRADPAALQTDHRGAKSRVERVLVDVIERAPGKNAGAYADEVHSNPAQVQGVLMGLVRRGVLTCKDGGYFLAETAPTNNGNPLPDDARSSEGISEDLADAGVL